MPFNRLNVYPDSDFFSDSLEAQQPVILDLTHFKVHQVNGEAMVKLSDLKTLNITIQVIEGEVIEFPRAA